MTRMNLMNLLVTVVTLLTQLLIKSDAANKFIALLTVHFTRLFDAIIWTTCSTDTCLQMFQLGLHKNLKERDPKRLSFPKENKMKYSTDCRGMSSFSIFERFNLLSGLWVSSFACNPLLSGHLARRRGMKVNWYIDRSYQSITFIPYFRLTLHGIRCQIVKWDTSIY